MTGPTRAAPTDAPRVRAEGTRRSRRTQAVRLGPRSIVALVLTSIIGLAAFAWPLLLPTDAAVAHQQDAPLIFGVLLVLVMMVVLAEISDGGIDAKAVAMLGVLTAVGAALRPLGTGVAGFEPVFFLLVLAGRALGPGFGFVLGATTLFASALTTGGVGPWLPFQMLGAAWVGAGAGLLPPARGRGELVMLGVYGAVAGLLYGLLLNLSFWPFTLSSGTGLSFVPGDPLADNLRRFLLFSGATSLGFDVPRALITGGLVIATGRPLLRAFRRATRRAAFDADTTFAPTPPTRTLDVRTRVSASSNVQTSDDPLAMRTDP